MVPKRKPIKRAPVRKATAASKAQKPAPVRRAIPPVKKAEDKDFAQTLVAVRKDLKGMPIHVLSMPWEAKSIATTMGAKWHPELRCHLYEGLTLPPQLAPYASEDFSLERWIEDELNGFMKPLTPSAGRMTPRPHQKTAIKKIIACGKAGWRGFILADNVGLGKSLEAIIGAYGIAQYKGFSPVKKATLLVISPKSVIPHWRNTIKASGVDNMRIVVINYDQAKKLLDVPAKAAAAARTKTKNRLSALYGKPTIRWDLIIADESHKCFPSETLISTDQGMISIGDIVENKMPVQIWTRNDSNGKLELKPINTYMSSLAPDEELATIKHENGTLTGTRNHPIWTSENKYTELGEIYEYEKEKAKNLPQLREGLYLRKQKSSNMLAKMLHRDNEKESHPSPSPKNLRRMPRSFQTQKGKNDVLQQKMFLQNEEEQRRTANKKRGKKQRSRGQGLQPVSRNISRTASRFRSKEILFAQMWRVRKSSFNFRAYEEKQPHARSRGQETGKQSTTRAHISFARGKWSAYCSSIATSRSNRVSNGIRYTHKQEMGFRKFDRKPTSILQVGSSPRRIKNLDRSGRKITQQFTLEVLRQEENPYLIPSRVEGYSIQERRNTGGPRASSTGYTRVYNLEIEDNSNYFANSVLVHNCKNISQRSNAFNRIARYSESPTTAPFVIWASATIGQNPLEVSYLAPLISQINGGGPIPVKEWGKWLMANNFLVKESVAGNYSWIAPKKEHSPSQRAEIQKLQAKDVTRLADMLFGAKSPSMRRNPEEIAGWPTQSHYPTPLDLDGNETALYLQVWNEFRSFMNLHPRGKNPSGGLAATMRFQQKASLITAPHTASFAHDMLDNGLQVALSVKFIETLDTIKEALEKKGWVVAEFSGRNTNEREEERLKFQRGDAQVILFTVEEGISLHAKEQLSTGETASSNQRVLLIHDVRYSSIAMSQILGRATRDGELAAAYYMYAEGTIEPQILNVMLQKMKNLRTLSGDDDATIDVIHDILDGINHVVRDVPKAV